MSWVSKVLGSISHVALKVAGVITSPVATAIEQDIPMVAGFAALINPKLHAIIDKGVQVVNGVEALITTAQSGAVKKQTAVQIMEAELPNIQELVADFGSGFKVPTDELNAAISTTADFFNAWQKVYAAIHAANPPKQ